LELARWFPKIFEYLDMEIYDIRFRPDGQYIAAAAEDHDVLIWNVRTGQLVEKLVGHRTG
jgi:WD40 repeat protein